MGPSASNVSSGGGGGAQFKSSVFGDQDAEELFRAFFGTGSTNVGGGGGRSNSSAVDLHAGDLIQRLVTAFSKNPWTLVTLLSGLASLVNIAETLGSQFGAKAIAAVPCVAAGVYFCPSQYRRYAMMAFAVVLFSGFI